MSDDMSMFKTMKEKITDEVKAAMSELPSLQLIGESAVASGVEQNSKNDPDSSRVSSNQRSSSDIKTKNQFSLLDDVPAGSYEEDELNSETSPQHQLLDASIFRTLKSQCPTPQTSKNYCNYQSSSQSITHAQLENMGTDIDSAETVINVAEISSDLEDGLDTPNLFDRALDVEIDLLSDKPSIATDYYVAEGQPNRDDLINYSNFCKTKYKNIVRASRKLHRELAIERIRFAEAESDLKSQVASLRTQLDNAKIQNGPANQQDSPLASSPQPTTKASTKIKDLERLLAKCKESLKLKNSQIKVLKESLSEVEQFKDFNKKLKSELADLREAHESWTVSIAQNKKIMHQEIEDKNAEIEALKAEINELHSKIRQMRLATQDLESRLVSTSAAHQKERESLTKELTTAKNNAMRQMQREHEHKLERVKLNFEKSIEVMKHDALSKDEQLMKVAEEQKRLLSENQLLAERLGNKELELQAKTKTIGEIESSLDQTKKECSDLSNELELLKSRDIELNDLGARNIELTLQVETLQKELSLAKSSKIEIERTLKEFESKGCDRCTDLEKLRQDIHDLNARQSEINMENDDQAKEIALLKEELKSLRDAHDTLKISAEELAKKNEFLNSVIHENESDLQTQQQQLESLDSLKRDIESLKKENSSLTESLSALRILSDERNTDMQQLTIQNEQLSASLQNSKIQVEDLNRICEVLRADKENLAAQNEDSSRSRRKLDEDLVVRILAAMRILESPNASPISEKSNESCQQSSFENGKPLPDQVALMDELASVALERSNSYSSTNQRLQAVLLENSIISEELKRLKEELNDLNKEKTEETRFSVQETEKLVRENQALIHDQQAYEEKIDALEKQIETMRNELNTEARDGTEDSAIRAEELETAHVPDSTEFEYLKNIGEFDHSKRVDLFTKFLALTKPFFVGHQFTSLCWEENLSSWLELFPPCSSLIGTKWSRFAESRKPCNLQSNRPSSDRRESEADQLFRDFIEMIVSSIDSSSKLSQSRATNDFNLCFYSD